MQAIPVIAIFDIGKTNKKLFLFDKSYKIVYEQSAKFSEMKDEDGDPCEDLQRLRLFIFDSLREISKLKEFIIKAINFSAYGASFVYIDKNGESLTPLYNYLKPYPENLRKKFYDTYGGETKISMETCSPILGNLNSGMQLYRLKYEKGAVFKKIKYALHLPQYLSYTFTGIALSDMTSIGCHTNLWNFQKRDYDDWVYEEGINEKLAPIFPWNKTMFAAFPGSDYLVGTGIHDSSSAMIPYLLNFQEPFVLISTGTWCISLNPFNSSPLTSEEIEKDCLCYLSYLGKPIKASRLFSGNEHEEQLKQISEYYGQTSAKYRDMEFDPTVYNTIKKKKENFIDVSKIGLMKESPFSKRDFANFHSDTEAYHQLIFDLVRQQALSTEIVLKGTEVKKIYVDGGFSKNSIFMNMMALSFPEMEIYAAELAQASAIGAALAMHYQWNKVAMPNDIIKLKRYSGVMNVG
jgi:sugar (pentulose or hexulose) kinase